MKLRIPTGLGISSLLVIFSVLCICVFVMLSASAAKNQQDLTESAQQSVTDYYAADSRAQEILARLRSGERPEGVTEENGIYSYSCPISENRILAVSVRVWVMEYEILRWQAVSTAHWQPEETLPVWQGQ